MAEVVKEMQILRDWLTAEGIPWYDDSDEIMCRTKFHINGHEWSVINGYGSYGGWTQYDPLNKGKLEVMAPPWGIDPEGHLNASAVILAIKGTLAGTLMPHLERCPFCGGKAQYNVWPDCEGYQFTLVVQCTDCGGAVVGLCEADGPERAEEWPREEIEKLAKEWNSRA